MALNYDFDMFDVVPSDVSDDPELQQFLNDAGFDMAPEMGQIALFREIRTADALRNAPEPIRAFFLESGFGLNTYDSGAPCGRYPAKDEEARLDLIRRLTENAVNFPLANAETGGADFCLSDFLDQLGKSSPIDFPAGDNGAVDAISPAIPKNQVEGLAASGRGHFMSLTSRLVKAMPRLRPFRRSTATP